MRAPPGLHELGRLALEDLVQRRNFRWRDEWKTGQRKLDIAARIEHRRFDGFAPNSLEGVPY